jgi:hypothetical protein
MVLASFILGSVLSVAVDHADERQSLHDPFVASTVPTAAHLPGPYVEHQPRRAAPAKGLRDPFTPRIDLVRAPASAPRPSELRDPFAHGRAPALERAGTSADASTASLRDPFARR